jgi:transcriptional regulator with XRE-family HTH domain
MSNTGMRRQRWDQYHEKLRKLLRDIRNDANLTQEELADRLGTKQSFISKYERGERNLDFVEVITVCVACEYPPEKLIQDLGIS